MSLPTETILAGPSLYIDVGRIFACLMGELEMQCPKCAQHSPDSWWPMFAYTPADPDAPHPFNQGSRQTDEFVARVPDQPKLDEKYKLEWMRCGDAACNQLVIRVQQTFTAWNKSENVGIGLPTWSWLAVPRGGQRPLDPRVPDPFKSDFGEAVSILELSPRMSAVLARRILADLLKQYAERPEYQLGDKLKKFSEDSNWPSNVRTNAQTLNEIARFAAHTQQPKDDQAAIKEVAPEEAKWTLDFIERLFDVFIVGPARDEEMKQRMEERRDQTDRKPPKNEQPS